MTPTERAKARDELRELKLNYLGDFNTFYSEFIHLANLSSKTKDLWRRRSIRSCTPDCRPICHYSSLARTAILKTTAKRLNTLPAV